MIYKTEKNYWQQDIRKREYLRIFAEGAGLVLILSYVFYGTFLGAILLSPILIGYFRMKKAELIKKKQSLFQLQFKDAIQSISAALNVGYSVENAMKEAFSELRLLYKEDDKIIKEFSHMIHQMDMNVTMEQALNEFAFRTQDEEVQTFVTVFSMAKRSGGDMIRIIQNAIHRISERTELLREMEALVSAKKMEFRIMSVIPIGMLLYISISFPEFVKVLYGNMLGVVFMSICLVIYIATYLLGKKIVDVEV